MKNLRQKTLVSSFWAFIQQVGSKGISMITMIIMARLLTPREFGLIGMLTVFIALSQTLIQAGFKQALIQKKDTDNEDYSSVFFINLIVSVILYWGLYFLAPLIAQFYKQPILIEMTRVLSLIFIINAFSYVQEARLNKEMKFKILAVIHIPSIVISGVVGISMAYLGYGVWSLIGQQLSMRLAYTIQIWFYAKWIPLWRFNKERVRQLFSFGGNLLLSGIIDTIFRNIYLIVIGKFFPVATLGYYQNAKKLVDTPSRTLSSVLRSVAFPAFSSIQDDNKRLQKGFRMMMQQVMFWLCPIMVLAGVLAKPIFSIVLTDKWLPAVPFFQWLCVVGIFYPLNSYNLNIVNVKGRSDVFLKLEILKKIIVVIGLVVTIPMGVWALVIFQVINSIITYFINSHFSGGFIQYKAGKQLMDVLPILAISVFVGGLVYGINKWVVPSNNQLQIIVGAGLGASVYWLLAYTFKLTPYIEFKDIFKTTILKRFAK